MRDIEAAKRIAYDIIRESGMVKQTWLQEYGSSMKMVVVPMEVLRELLLFAEEANTNPNTTEMERDEDERDTRVLSQCCPVCGELSPDGKPHPDCKDAKIDEALEKAERSERVHPLDLDDEIAREG